MSHFCTCGDDRCPFNPHNPANDGKGCDLCITKCLRHGEIPNCFFKAVNSERKPEGGYTYRHFAEFVLNETKEAEVSSK